MKRTVNIKTIIMLKSVNAPPSIGTVSFAAIVPNTTYIPIVSIINPEAIIWAKEGTVSEPSCSAEIFRRRGEGVVRCHRSKRPDCISVNEARISPAGGVWCSALVQSIGRVGVGWVGGRQLWR
jgi:hypothetical protein